MNVAKKLLEVDKNLKLLWVYTRPDFDTQNLLILGCDLSRIFVASAFTPNDLIFALAKASYNHEIRLIVIDNVALPFLNHPDQFSLIKKFGSLLRLTISLLPAICLTTNYIHENLDWFPSMLGETWSSFVDQKLLFYRGRNGERLVTLAKCFDQKNGCKSFKKIVKFSITNSLTFESEETANNNNKTIKPS